MQGKVIVINAIAGQTLFEKAAANLGKPGKTQTQTN